MEEKRIDYVGRFTTLFILMGVVFSILFFVILYFQEKSNHDMVNQVRGEQYLSDQQEKFYAFYHNYEKYLYAIASNRFFIDFLSQNSVENRHDVIDLFKTLVEHDVQVTQLRYIDKSGQEVIRVDRPTLTSDVIVIQPDELQNKADRGYFKEAMKKKPDELYVSKLDLNIEHGKIEVPHKPVWRFAIPIVKEGRNQGILIVNVFAEPLFKSLLSSLSFYVTVYDHDRYILATNIPNTPQWTRYLDGKMKVDSEAFTAKKILIEGVGGETIKIGLKPKNANVFDTHNTQESFLILLGITVPIAFIIAYWIAQIPRRLFDRLENQQKMMLQQSKQAAMGEMISAIAHQWRQPLNAVGVLVQEIDAKYQMEVLEKEDMTYLSNEVLNYLEYMSKTIQDFSNFLKPSSTKKLFDVITVVNETLKLMDSQFQNHEISISVIIPDDPKKEENLFMVNGNSSEFKQALMNILHNAKDALESSGKPSKQITISFRRDKENIHLTITDNGGGISAEMLETLFEPYQSTKYEQNGTGLGLYITKTIIEQQMGGQIHARNVGDGAEFEIILHRRKEV